MGNQISAIAQVLLAIIRAIAFAIRVFAFAAHALAITKGNAADPTTLASALSLPFSRFLA